MPDLVNALIIFFYFFFIKSEPLNFIKPVFANFKASYRKYHTEFPLANSPSDIPLYALHHTTGNWHSLSSFFYNQNTFDSSDVLDPFPTAGFPYPIIVFADIWHRNLTQPGYTIQRQRRSSEYRSLGEENFSFTLVVGLL